MNKYEKLGVIGEGTFGEVFKCRHKETDEVVAIKKFKEQSDEDEATKKITLREVKLLRALKHECIVELKEAFRRKGVLYLVFEYVEQSVMDLLEAKPKGVGSETVHTLTYQLLRALEHCHRHNVIHRDIKPENLLVNTSDNSLRLCDFGCARQIKANVALTDYVATRWYRPPELLLSTTDYGKGVDMWGLGCIMGELTDGQPLFAGKSDIDQLCVIQKILGPLTSEQMERCLELTDFKGIKFPDVTSPVTLQKRYASQMPEHHMNLLTSVLVMDAAQRLSAKAALRSPCFKELRAKDAERPLPQPQQVASGVTEKENAKPNSKNAYPVAAAVPELGLPPKVPTKLSTEDADVPPWMRDEDTWETAALAQAEKPQMSQAPARMENEKAQMAHSTPKGAASGLPSLGAAFGTPMEEPEPARSKKEKKLPQDSSGSKKDFRTSQDGFGAFGKRSEAKKDFRTSQDGFGAFGAKREAGMKKDFRASQEGFGALGLKREKVAKKDFRASQEGFGAKRKESFGAKGGLRAPLEGEQLTCEESLEDFLAAPLDSSRPAPSQRKDTPQAADMYRLPWDSSAASVDPGMDDPARTPTPIFGNGSQKGFLFDPRSTGGGAAAGAQAKAPLLSMQAPVAQVAQWKTLGVTKSRWSGA